MSKLFLIEVSWISTFFEEVELFFWQNWKRFKKSKLFNTDFIVLEMK